MTLETPPEWAAHEDLCDRFRRVVDPYATPETMLELHGIEVNPLAVQLVERTWSRDNALPLWSADGRHLRWAWRIVLQRHELVTVKEASIAWLMSEESMEEVVRRIGRASPRPLAMSDVDSAWGPRYLDARVLKDIDQDLRSRMYTVTDCCSDVYGVVLHQRLREVYGVEVEPALDEMILSTGERAYARVHDVVAGTRLSLRRQNVWLSYRDRPLAAPADTVSLPTLVEIGDEAVKYLADYDLRKVEEPDVVGAPDDCGRCDPRLSAQDNWRRYFGGDSSEPGAAST